MSGGDKRRTSRIAPRDCYLRVLVRVPVMMRDIGTGGALLEAPVAVPAQTQAHLRTMLRGRRFETDLDVGRLEAGGQPGAPASRLGVRFTNMDEESRNALVAFLAVAHEPGE